MHKAHCGISGGLDVSCLASASKELASSTQTHDQVVSEKPCRCTKTTTSIMCIPIMVHIRIQCTSAY